MKSLIFIIMIAVAGLGCDKKDAEGAKAEGVEATEETGKEEAKTEEGAPEPAEAPTTQGEAKPSAELVEVTKEGTTFDPPVKPEQIPAGAWYCDMGTVEYARLEKGDGKCPKCGMFLKEKTGEGAAKPAPKADDHGHDHDSHDGHEH